MKYFYTNRDGRHRYGTKKNKKQHKATIEHLFEVLEEMKSDHIELRLIVIKEIKNALLFQYYNFLVTVWWDKINIQELTRERYMQILNWAKKNNIKTIYRDEWHGHEIKKCDKNDG
jgi:hypothetical protein